MTTAESHGFTASRLREMQSIIARSKPDECVGLLCPELLDHGMRPDNALLDPS